MTRLAAFLKQLKRDARGTSVIEFALVAPILGVLVVGIADYARGFSERFALEAAAHRALERAAVGSTSSDYNYVRLEAAAAAGVPIESVTLDNWVECDGTRQSTYSAACADGQQVARYLYVKIVKTFEPNFKWTRSAQPINIQGDAAVRVQ